MSGPKVIVVESEEEIRQRQLREQRQLLVELSNAIAIREEAVKRSGANVDSARTQTDERRKALIQAFEKDHGAAAMSVRREIPFILQEAERMQDEAAEVMARKSKRKRVLQQNIKNLLNSSYCSEAQRADLERIGLTLNSMNEKELDTAAEGINKIVAALASSAANAQTDHAKNDDEFLSRLKDGAFRVAEPTIKMRAADSADAIKDKLELLLAKATLLDETAATQFQLRIESLIERRNDPNLVMKLETLTIELSSELRKLKEQKQNLQALNGLVQLLEGYDDADDLKKRIARAQEQNDSSRRASLQCEVSEFIEQKGKELVERKKRDAVLAALKSMGYDVKEGMCTAWVKSGTLVLKKPGEKQYGVQLAAARSFERMQVRVVSLGPAQIPPSATDDKVAEEKWCSEFQQMTADLQAHGYALKVEAATQPGVTPLRRCPVVTDEAVQEEEREAPGKRLRARE